MSDSQPSQVFTFESGDPDMLQANENARATFRYFWRELAWEQRRIIPALDLACVKSAFTDGPKARPRKGKPTAEQMWIGEVDFDGEFVTGVLLNSPNWLTSIQAGDPVRLTLPEITDWMYAIGGDVYGAYTVNLMRSRMKQRERREHDAAWGLNFGDAERIRVVPEEGDPNQVIGEHPMSEAMAASLRDTLTENPAMIDDPDERGWTLLHQLALAGSLAGVEVLVERGAKVNARTESGKTALQLAQSLQWNKVIDFLVGAGAK